MHSINPGINKVLAAFAQYREEMLKALDHPGLPMHNMTANEILGL